MIIADIPIKYCPDPFSEGRLIILGFLVWILVVLLIVFRKKLSKFIFWLLLIPLVLFGLLNSYEKVRVFPGDCAITGVSHYYRETGNFSLFPKWMYQNKTLPPR